MLRRIFPFAVFLFCFALLAIPPGLQDRSNEPPEVTAITQAAPVIELAAIVVNHLLPATAIAQAVRDSGISADTATRSSGGHSALFWLACVAVVAAVFFGGRYLYRKYMAEDAYPRQRAP